MSRLGNLEERLEKKRQQKQKIDEEITNLEGIIAKEKEAILVKPVRELNLTESQLQMISKGIKEGSVMEFLENLYQMSVADPDATSQLNVDTREGA